MVRIQSPPVHHIDTSVLLESKDKENAYFTRKYRNLLGIKFLGKVSIFVFGELFLYLYRLGLVGKNDEAHNLLDSLQRLFKVKKISLATVHSMSSEIAVKIREIDPRISPMDSLIVANAIGDGTNLVTLDKKLIRNQTIEREFGIKIRHPKDILSF